MARVMPEHWQNLEASGAAGRELETLAVLAAGLPDAYTVLHSVHWTRVEGRHAAFGEVDFIILARSGKALLIEQKSGILRETAEGLVKVYAQREKAVPVQMARSADALRARFAAGGQNGALDLDVLLYCPDYHVRDPLLAGIDPARIVDAGKRERLVAIIRRILPEDSPDSPDYERLFRFFAGQMQLVPDVSAMVGQAQQLFTRISGGLAHWARQIDAAPFRLRVIGTAGSGKTQLALALLRDADAAGQRMLYVCYNRPLADHMSRVAPSSAEVATYHQLCDRTLTAAGRRPDFGAPDPFRRIEADFSAWTPDPAGDFDGIIVDEGQDFTPAWRDGVLRLLRPDGRAWWLEDPMQNLYGREPVPLPGWTVLHARTNYRSPRDVLRHLDRLLPGVCDVEPGSPLDGSDVGIETYADAAGLIEGTKRLLTRALGLGFRREQIALLSFRGREHSLLAGYDRLGPHRLRTFTGRYDLLGGPVYSDGDLLFETVYRFKGQSAPCVILGEIDFEQLDEAAQRKLFVGMTRATLKLFLLLSERSARVLLEQTG